VDADLKTLASIVSLHPAKLKADIRKRRKARARNLSTFACGEAPLLAGLEAARRLGAREARIVSYANSGDTALGDRSRIVGYGAVVFLPGAEGPAATPTDVEPLWRPQASEHEGALTEEEGRRLVAFARQTIRNHLETGTAPLARDLPPALWRKQGVFVTLKKRGRLRGCIGHRAADRPLGQVVGAMALQAAFNDRRFWPMRPDELGEIEIEVSLLSPLKRVADPEAIVVGRDGVLLQKQGKGAIYLPEVAVEQGWDREQMLGHLCRKGGLPADAWREGAELYTFQTEVLHEARP
jgi:hypothetical protein